MVKEPEHYLPVEECGGSFEKGVCAGHIERLGKVAQSTMSNHLSCITAGGSHSGPKIWTMVLFFT